MRHVLATGRSGLLNHTESSQRHISWLRNSVAVLAASATATVGLGFAGGVARAAGTTYGFSRAVGVRLPSNAAKNYSTAALNAASCTSLGNCVAVGSYETSSGRFEAMVATEKQGHWGEATEVMFAASAYAIGNPEAALLGVSCVSAGNCTAVGVYENIVGHHEALTVAEKAGTWGKAIEVLPTLDPEYFAQLNGVSCTSVGNCVAVGSYENAEGEPQAMTATETTGKWAKQSKVSSPAGAGTSGNTYATLAGVSCKSAGNCSAVGYYENASGGDDLLALSEKARVWGKAVEVGSPTGAASAWFQGVSCTSAGNCTAVGYFRATSGGYDLMVAPDKAGKWGEATEVGSPAGTGGWIWQRLLAVSCTSVGNCAAVGYYENDDDTHQAITAIESAGTWTPAELGSPSGAGTGARAGSSLSGVSCTSAGSCSAVGTYKNSSTDTLAMAAGGVIR